MTTTTEIIPVTIESELKQSYLDYAMSVIVGRALPDVRDGLKPVHRRVLYAMGELSNDYNKPYKKSARIVGDVIGKYHPHGDVAVYDTIVRMAQPFSMRYVLVDGQGNFGSVDGDAPAAMRYTEIRLSKLAHSLMADLDKETVDFVPNYDGTEQAPVVFPTRLPNLLINGSSGIAVGMATNIPPHNLTEVIHACLALLEEPSITLDRLMQHLPGPDFPTAGIICGRSGIFDAYRSGRGRVVVRAKTHIETDERTNKQTIITTELPYQVNKARLIERIAELVKEKKIEGISALRDESDKDGLRMVIELKRGENADLVLNHLFTQTAMQSVFGINMVALLDGQPRILDLKTILEAFLRHRREVVTRRTLFELNKARERAHVLEGLGIALANIDPVIALIKSAKDPAEAKEKLLREIWASGIVVEMLQRAGDLRTKPEALLGDFGATEKGYKLSPVQAQAILDLRLQRLTALEQDKILAEYQEQLDAILSLTQILEDPDRLKAVIHEELKTIVEEFGDTRRTTIAEAEADLDHEDLIPSQEVVVTVSHEGYAKIQPMEVYETQRRGGKGKAATSVKEEDFVEHLLLANTHDTLLCFSSFGKVYWLKVYRLPEASRQSRGRPIINLLSLAEGERINAFLAVKEYVENRYVLMVTSQGVVKKTALSNFSRPRNGGIVAVDLRENDQLVGVALTDGEQDVLLFTDAGKVIRFHEGKIRAMGRLATGVRGVKMQPGQEVIALIIAKPHGEILTATENGFGKRTPIEEHRLTGRGGQGVVAIQTSERNGKVVGATQVFPTDEVMLISDKGTLVRTRVDEIRSAGRNSQGVRLIRLHEGEKLMGLQPICFPALAMEVNETAPS